MARSAQYISVADQLARRWERLAPGTLVESEHQIADEFDINRLTAREAVRELERRMVVRREMGRGTFTAYRLDYVIELGGVASFQRALAALGHTADTRVIDKTWVGRRPRRRLDVVRVSSVDGFEATCATESFPHAVGARLEDDLVDGASVHGCLTALGLRPRRSSVQVAMIVPPSDVGERLRFSTSTMPTWRVTSTTVDEDSGTTIHWSESWMRTDMFAVTVRLDESTAR